MTFETTSSLSPGEVLAAARRYLAGGDGLPPAWLENESEGHLSFGTFRGNIAVAAFPDPSGEAPTRIRVTTLRDEGVVSRLMTYLGTLDAPAREGAGARRVAGARTDRDRA